MCDLPLFLFSGGHLPHLEYADRATRSSRSSWLVVLNWTRGENGFDLQGREYLSIPPIHLTNDNAELISLSLFNERFVVLVHNAVRLVPNFSSPSPLVVRFGALRFVVLHIHSCFEHRRFVKHILDTISTASRATNAKQKRLYLSISLDILSKLTTE